MGHREREQRQLAIFLVLVFCAGVFSVPIGSLLPVYVDSTLHQPPGFTATLKVLQLAMTGVFALVGGALADRFGQKRVLLVGFGGLPIGLLVFSVHVFWILAAGVIALGMATSLQTVGGQSYLVATANQKRLGAYTAFYYLGNTLGGALGNAIAGTAADRFGFSSVGLVGGLMSLSLIVIAAKVLPDAAHKRTTPTARRSPFTEYISLLRDSQIALVGSIRFLTTCFYGSTSLLFPLLVYRLSGSITTASLYSTVSLIAATATQLLVGRIVDRFGASGPVRVLTASVLVAAIAASMSAHSLPTFFVTGVIATSILWGLSTTMTSLARAASSPDRQGRVLGLLHLLWSAGMLVGTAVGGTLVSIEPAIPFAFFAVVNIGSVLAALVLCRRLAVR
jgi:AAHS family 4-hydroxybenzoate transporter-like MFS transporter